MYRIFSVLSSKTSWEVSKKSECNNIVQKWQSYFQAFDYKRKQFLDLNNNNGLPICPTYSKDRAWLKHFGLSNLLCTHITRLITNYAPIGEYRLQFFSNKSFACHYSNSPIEMRTHILYGCVCYRKSWNPK